MMMTILFLMRNETPPRKNLPTASPSSPSGNVCERIPLPPPPRVVRDPRDVKSGQEGKQPYGQQAPRRPRGRARQPARRRLPRKHQADGAPDEEQEGDRDLAHGEGVRGVDVLAGGGGGLVGPAVGGGLKRRYGLLRGRKSRREGRREGVVVAFFLENPSSWWCRFLQKRGTHRVLEALVGAHASRRGGSHEMSRQRERARERSEEEGGGLVESRCSFFDEECERSQRARRFF